MIIHPRLHPWNLIWGLKPFLTSLRPGKKAALQAFFNKQHLLEWYASNFIIKKAILGAGEVAQWWRALTALSRVQISIPSTHIAHGNCTHLLVCRCTWTQSTHIHKTHKEINIFFKKEGSYRNRNSTRKTWILLNLYLTSFLFNSLSFLGSTFHHGINCLQGK